MLFDVDLRGWGTAKTAANVFCEVLEDYGV